MIRTYIKEYIFPIQSILGKNSDLSLKILLHISMHFQYNNVFLNVAQYCISFKYWNKKTKLFLFTFGQKIIVTFWILQRKKK